MSKDSSTTTFIEDKEPIAINRHTSIQASAGTGKTYSLTALVTRLVAERDLRADQILLMTFTNEATAELRQKTRLRCLEALQALRNNNQSIPWTRHMFASDADCQRAIRNLDEFLSRYDEVSITTIHGFCQTVLRQTGLSSQLPVNAKVVTSLSDIIDQTITDVLADTLFEAPLCLWEAPATQQSSDNNNPQLKFVKSTLTQIRNAVVTLLDNEGCVSLPAPNDSDAATTVASSKETLAMLVANTSRRIATEVQLRCKELGIVSYNDMIRLVRDSLRPDSDNGVTLAEHLGRQYPVVMVDEFQDTDMLQWEIFKCIFEASNNKQTLITVGDPKQAIYRFRGADVNVYLSAVEKAAEQKNLSVNRRSDAPLLQSLETILGDQTFDTKGLVPFVAVKADLTKSEYALSTNSKVTSLDIAGPPLEVRYIPESAAFGGEQPVDKRRRTRNTSDLVLSAVFQDVVQRIIELLSGCTITNLSDNRTAQPVTPSDIAILVSSHRDADSILARLQEVGIPAVRLKTGSVFYTKAANHWLMWLRALAYPSRTNYVRAYALSCFGGMSEWELSTSDVNKLISLQRTCAEDAEKMQRRGIIATYLSYRDNPEFQTRLLREADGLRILTDLDHIADVISDRPEFASSAGPLECLEVLQDFIDGAEDEADEQQRRIDTDHDAVKVMTIHASKGLQFPIVFLPTLMKGRVNRSPVMFPAELEKDKPSVRVIDLASKFDNAATWKFVSKNLDGEDVKNMESRGSVPSGLEVKSKGKLNRLILEDTDIQADSRRLLYVALTRAQHKVVCYWSPMPLNPKDPFIKAVKDTLDLSQIPTSREDLRQVFTQLSKKSEENINGFEIPCESQITGDQRWSLESDQRRENQDVTSATFYRDSENVMTFGFGRWSYSSITRRLKAGSLSTKGQAEQEATSGVGDESDVETTTTVAPTPFAWNGLPAGSGFGDAVHSVFDHIDPAAPNLREHVLEQVTATFASWGPQLDREVLTDALVSNIHVKLDRDFSGKSLADLGQRHRLSEMKFDFPLPADDGVKLSQLVDIIVGDPNISNVARTYFEKLRDSVGAQTQIAGFMNGSIDAVFRIEGDNHRFIVCDYKSNRLHFDTDTDPVARYNNASMEAKMLEDGYFFQALIYSLALHRYLKQRVANYDFDTHFGGVAYLFLRGLDGSVDDTGALRGYYRWMPSKQTVLQLDDIFTEELI